MTVDDQNAKEIENKSQGVAMRENAQMTSLARYLSDDSEKILRRPAGFFRLTTVRDARPESRLG